VHRDRVGEAGGEPIIDNGSSHRVEDWLITFEPRYNETALPCRWKFTPPDLEEGRSV
jgi:hypothetical protein